MTHTELGMNAKPLDVDKLAAAALIYREAVAMEERALHTATYAAPGRGQRQARQALATAIRATTESQRALVNAAL